MNKKIIVITILSIITGLVIFNIVNKEENAIKETEKKIINSNVFSMMLETEAGTGNYEKVTQSEWPQEGYIFNASLSRCENGSKLSWDNEAKKVIMNANVSDKCYIYFDLYNLPVINNVTFSTTSDSITVIVDASGGDGNIISYQFAIDDSNFISSNDNTYTFNNLSVNTNYNIKVYVTDSNNQMSQIYQDLIKIEIKLIEFTIDGQTMYAEENMTWNDFVSSKYNTSEVYIDADCGIVANRVDNRAYHLMEQSTSDYIISKNSIIKNNEAYITSTYRVEVC